MLLSFQSLSHDSQPPQSGLLLCVVDERRCLDLLEVSVLTCVSASASSKKSSNISIRYLPSQVKMG